MKKGRSFWRWLGLCARAAAMKDLGKRRIIRENIETWNRMNRKFIRQMEKEENRRIDRMCGFGSDESSTTAYFGGSGYGSDCGAGGDGGEGGDGGPV